MELKQFQASNELNKAESKENVVTADPTTIEPTETTQQNQFSSKSIDTNVQLPRDRKTVVNMKKARTVMKQQAVKVN